MRFVLRSSLVPVVLLSVLSVRAQTPQIVDSCFTSAGPGTSFPSTAVLWNSNSDILQWTGASWTGGWPGAIITIPPPVGNENCRVIFMGGSSGWTTGGEGVGFLLSAPLVAGQTYSFPFTYVSHGTASNGAFMPEVRTNNAPNYAAATIVGFLPAVGGAWTTNTFTFTATPGQNGHNWLFLHTTNGPTSSSGLISSWCSDCIDPPPPTCSVDLGPDLTLCFGDFLELDATIPNAISYEWQDGSMDATLIVTDPGTYWVTVTTPDCVAQDTVIIDVLFDDWIDFYGGYASLCDGETLVLDASAYAGATFLWQDGSTGPTFTVTGPGSYWVVADLGTCTAEGYFDADYFPYPAIDLGPDQSICAGTTLFLDATTPGATYAWQDGSNGPLYNVTTAGSYWVVVDVNSCTATDTVNVVVIDLADAGSDGALAVCDSEAPIDLITSLGGTPDAGGTWTGPGGQPFGGTFSPASDLPGAYVYLVTGTGACPNASATVTVSVTGAVDAGSNGSLVRCQNDPPVDLFTLLGGTPDAGGTWTTPGGIVFPGVLDPATAAPGFYTYTVTGTTPCPDDAASVQVTLVTPPNAGTDGALIFCLGQPPVALLGQLGGNPSAGGSWTNPSGALFGGTFNPAIHPPGTYTYTVAGQPPCANASATVSVSVGEAPNAGPDVTSCGLSQGLNATGNITGGVWSGPPGVVFSNPASPQAVVSATVPGTYTLVWTIDGSQGCGALDTVVVTLVALMDIVLSTSDAVCNGYCDGQAAAAVTGGSGGYTYAWSAGTPGTGPDQTTALCAGLVGVLVTDANGCQQATGALIGEPVPMVFSSLTVRPETCVGDCDGSIEATSPGAVSFTLASAPPQPDGTYTNLCPSLYTLTATDANGCFVTEQVEVAPADPVEAAFVWSPNPATVDNSTVNFYNTSSPNAVAFSWDFAGRGSANSPETSFTFPDVLGDEYVVCLTVTDVNACTDTHCERILVEDVPVVHVPNVFTPDGDGINDVFGPVFNMTVGVQDYSLNIYNRWGERIFTSLEPQDGWNGIAFGEPAPDGVYVWVVAYQEPAGKGRVEKRGHVTLLR